MLKCACAAENLSWLQHEALGEAVIIKLPYRVDDKRRSASQDKH